MRKLIWILAAASLAGACRPNGSPADRETFPTAESAVSALLDAARGDSIDALAAVLGPDTETLFVAGDPVAARLELANFVALYDEAHALEDEDDGTLTLLVGADEWPFPIPLVRDGDGWAFDTDRGRVEIRDRRVGRNELSAIAVCRAVGDAQEDFRALSPESSGAYATGFTSEEGRQNGLYWPMTEGGIQSPLGEFAARAAVEGYRRSESGERQPYHGYYYRILTAQGASAPGGERNYVVDGRMTGGHAVVAWPAEYRESGIMTFIMGSRGIVYERDLGPDTHEIASSMRAFDPDLYWAVCED